MACNIIESSSTFVENLEIFSIVWLDRDVDNSIENKTVRQQLRSIINNIRMFETSKECEEYIRDVDVDRLVLIINQQLQEDIIPKVHDLRQVSAIYVYDFNGRHSGELITKFNKVV